MKIFNKKCAFNRAFIPSMILGILMTATSVGTAVAAPVGGKVMMGTISITYSPPVTRVVQESDQAVILWDNFDLGSGERLEIIQPALTSRLVNRVKQNAISILNGEIRSNGQVLILNPDGVHLQSSASAEVGGLILSGLDLRSASEVGNPIRLRNADVKRMGSVRNQGSIQTADGGNAVLIGNTVVNEGSISGQRSSVALAVGRGANVLFEENGLINLNISEAQPKPVDLGVSPLVNTGDIQIPGGRILLTGSKTPRVFNLLSETGVEFAYESKITLVPGASFNFGTGVRVSNTGDLNVGADFRAPAPFMNAGRIVIIGDEITSDAWLSAFANTGGVSGEITLAAANQVELKGSLSLAEEFDFLGRGGNLTVLGRTLVVEAGISSVRGGTIILGGEGTRPSSQLRDTLTTVVANSIYAFEGGSALKIWAKDAADISGQIYLYGGNIELVSGNKMHLHATVSNYSYDADIAGSALIKAKDLVVRYGEDPWTVNALALDRLVGGGDVTLRAERNLTIEGKPSVIFLSGSILSRGEPDPHGSLVLSAGNDLRLNTLDVSGLRNVELVAGNDIHISSFTASGYDSFMSCAISAGGNVYLKNSIFVNWCYATIPSGIEAGGEVEMKNVYFYNFPWM